jgi:hypothetical protein
VTERPQRLLIRQRRWWWVACNPDEALALMDTQTYVRALTRERVIEKATRRFFSCSDPWEEVEVSGV